MLSRIPHYLTQALVGLGKGILLGLLLVPVAILAGLTAGDADALADATAGE